MELRIFIEPQQGADYDTQLRIARAAEDLGFGAFFRSDHYLAMGSADGLPGPTDSWVTLAGLARETRSIRLGTLVSAATFRLPGPLAIAVAQVDQMSGGRIELGLGSGWFAAEHSAYGIPFPADPMPGWLTMLPIPLIGRPPITSKNDQNPRSNVGIPPRQNSTLLRKSRAGILCAFSQRNTS